MKFIQLVMESDTMFHYVQVSTLFIARKVKAERELLKYKGFVCLPNIAKKFSGLVKNKVLFLGY